MERRQFITKTCHYTALAGGVMILPNFQFIDEFLYLGEKFTIDAYRQDYQDLLPKKSSKSLAAFNMATKKQLGLGYSDTQFLNPSGWDNDTQGILDSMKNAGFIPYTPPVTYKNAPNAGKSTPTSHTNTGVITKVQNPVKKLVEESGFFLGFEKVEKVNGYWEAKGRKKYIVFNDFLKYVSQYEDYFCYGQPCSNPTYYECLDCGQKFVTQDFFYEGDTKFGRKRHNFWNNAECSVGKLNANKMKVHRVDKNRYPNLGDTLETLNLKPIKTCVCVDDLKSHVRDIDNNR